MRKSKAAGNIAAAVFLYFLLFHYRTFVLFWTPLLSWLDASGNLVAIVAFITPALFGIFVGRLFRRLLSKL